LNCQCENNRRLEFRRFNNERSQSRCGGNCVLN
jgi:hypothetical protein